MSCPQEEKGSDRPSLPQHSAFFPYPGSFSAPLPSETNQETVTVVEDDDEMELTSHLPPPQEVRDFATVRDPARAGDRSYGPSGAKRFQRCCVPHFIRSACRSVELLSQNTQMMIMSAGMDASAVAASLLTAAWQEGRIPPAEASALQTAVGSGWGMSLEKVFCVVLPDGISSEVLNECAASLRYALKEEITLRDKGATHAEMQAALPVHPLTEGLSTKERCQVYLHGGVVLGAGRVFCADILHRRLSPDLITFSLYLLTQEAVGAGRGGSSRGLQGARLRGSATNSFAFLIDLVREGGRGAVSAARAVSPHVVTYSDPPLRDDVLSDFASATSRAVILSDSPLVAQALVQRHQRGFPRFTQQMRVGDIQLFPRFRLEIIQHYERRSREASASEFKVDRVEVQPSASTTVLDGLLEKILKEIWSELQQMQRRVQEAEMATRPLPVRGGAPQGTGGGQRGVFQLPSSGQVQGSRGQQRRQVALLLDEATGTRFLPRSDGTGSMAGGASNNAKSQQTPAYIRKPWRDPADPWGIRFDWLPEDSAVNVSEWELDTDLRASLRAQAVTASATTPGTGNSHTEWPFKSLVQSLLDVRQLRRDAQHLTPYAFLWSLEKAVRLRRQRAFASAAATALWTLSSHYGDVMTIATERIGSIVAQNTVAAPTAATVLHCASDVEDGGDGEVEVVKPMEKGSSAGSEGTTLALVPSMQHSVDPSLEVLVTMISSWSRGVLRRVVATAVSPSSSSSGFGKRGRSPSCATHDPALNCPHEKNDSSPAVLHGILLVVCFGRGSVLRAVQRCCYGKDGYQQLQLNQFIQLYQLFHKPGGMQAIEEVNAVQEQLKQECVDEWAEMSQKATPSAENPTSRDLREQLWRLNSIAEDCLVKDVENDNEEGDETTPYGSRKRNALHKAKASESHRPSNGKDSLAAAAPRSSEGGEETAEMPVEEGDEASEWSDGGVGFLFSQFSASIRSTQRDSLNHSRASLSLHDVLMSQTLAPLPTTTTDPPALVGTNEKELEEVHAISADNAPRQSKAGGGVGEMKRSSASSSSRHMGINFEIVQWSGSMAVVAATSLAAANPSHGKALIAFVDGETLQERDLACWLRGTHPVLRGCASEGNTTSTTPPPLKDILLTSPDLTVMRMLETVMHNPHLTEATSSAHRNEGVAPKGVRVRLLCTPLANGAFQRQVEAEREAFEALAHTKATLTSTLLADRDSMRATEEALEAGLALARRSRRPQDYKGKVGSTFFDAGIERQYPENPRVIFDDREFRSGLPYALYAAGMDLVPLTLITADYVLSREYAVERKSVPDYLQSLQSGRLLKQLAAMSRQYKHPMCLVEFSLGEPFRLVYPTPVSGRSSSTYAHTIFHRSGRLMAKYPRALFLWSRNSLHSAALFLRLKQTVAKQNVDPSDPSLTMSAVALQEQEDSAGAASKEAAHTAARVLSCFPGVTPRNAQGIMRLCGSLIGLATISQASLLHVMSEAEAAKLYSFLHDPLVEEVG